MLNSMNVADNMSLMWEFLQNVANCFEVMTRAVNCRRVGLASTAVQKHVIYLYRFPLFPGALSTNID